jgi:quinol monooxygenase YgiN
LKGSRSPLNLASPISNSFHLEWFIIMQTQDRCCSIAPYFQVPDEHLSAFKALGEQFVTTAQAEPKCLYYGFAFDGNLAYCREGYADAAGLLFHLEHVGDLLQEALKLASLVRLEIHGSESELAQLREPLAAYQPQFFVLEYGFRR